MTAPEYGDWEAIWMGLEDTEAEDGWFPAEWDVTFNELSIFEKKVTFGRIDKDSDDIVSSYVISDWSGGGQIDLLTGADQSRYRHGILDARTPGAITLPQYVEELLPSGASGTSYPGYTLGQYSFHIFGSNIYGWDESDDTWSAATAIAHTPVGKPTVFNDELYWPLGTSGYARMTDSGGGVPVWSRYAGVAEGASSAATSSPTVVDFEVWDNKIWALTTTGVLAYSFTGADNAWNWDQAWDEARADFMKLDTARTPVRLITFPDNNGDPVLTIVSDAAVYRVDFVSKNYDKTAIQFPPHPDFGRGVCVFRPGEDLKIAVGLGMVSYSTAGVVDPDTGLSRNDGMPYSNLGTISDLEPDPSNLYAVVSGTQTSSVSYAYSDQVGAAGTGNGQFADVRGVDVDSTGDVQAADTNNERIQRFDNLLTFEATWGSAGTGNDHFATDDGPFDIAHDASDNLYITDHGNNRVKKTSRTGTYSAEITGADPIPAWVLQNTYSGIGLSSPRQVDVSPVDGTIMVTDEGADEIIVFNTSGVEQWSVSGMDSTRASCFDSSGHIWSIFNDNGTSDAYLIKYERVAADNYTVYDLDPSNVWGPSSVGIYISASGYANGVCTDDTYIYATFADNYVAKISPSDTSGNWVDFIGDGAQGSAAGEFRNPYGIAVSGSYLYVVDSNNNRIQKIAKSGMTYVAQWTIPAGSKYVDVDSNGYVVVSSTTGGTVTRYTNTGTLVDSFTQSGAYGVAVAGSDVVWVASDAANALYKWDEGVVAGTEAEAGENTDPHGIDVNRADNILYVADSGNNRINYYTASTLAYLGTWGSEGTGNGQFGTLGPTALAVDQTNDFVYVVDPSNFRVQQFGATGTFIRAWGSEGGSNSQFGSPTAIDVHPVSGSVFVGDATRDDVQEFSSSGVFLRRFGATGSGNGQFTGISGMAFNAAGSLLYVSDLSGERIQAFDTSTSTYEFLALPSIHYWTGTGWHGAWELEDSEETLTWATITATNHAVDGYNLWWGCTNGNIYRMPLRRTFHNPRSGWQAGYDRFAATGYALSSRFDALMAGFYKKASRLVVFMDNASPTERVRIQYRLDDELMPWTDFTDANGDTLYVTTKGRTVLPFGIDADGFSWGEQFNWIQFRFLFERGDNAYQTPVMIACVLNYTKVPQQARTFMFTVPFPKESWNGRNGIEIRNGLADLLRAGQYVKLVHQDTTYRGQLAAVAGLSSLGQNTTGGATVNFIEIRTDG
jgi:DNA-binding beta-propeller fold protein YncE